tara:strand:+ start:593 stop:1855 length:1263 start_codon:yes stop_codon:yes gene_type:complete
MEHKTAAKIFLLLYLTVPFIITNEMMLDINTLRLFQFSILNSIVVLYIFLVKDLSAVFHNVIKNKILLVLASFILWAAGSYFYAINGNEVIIRLFTFINFYVFIASIATLLIYIKIKFKDVALFISIVLLAELYFSYKVYFEIIEFTDYDFNMNNRLIGLFGNRNVTTSIYLMQLPFVIYTYLKNTKVFIKISSLFILYSTLYMVFLLSSRTSYLIMLMLSAFYFITFIYYNRFKLKSIYSSSFSVFTLAALLSFGFSTISLGVNNDASAINRVATIDVKDYSTATRLRYYGYAVEQLIKNPILGVGLGNWKIESIKYDNNNITSYIVPYTMHNDFLESSAELGLIGLILYILVFAFPIIYLARSCLEAASPEFVILLSSFFVFLIDSNLNFPFTRIATMFWFAMLLSLVILFLNKRKNA